MYHILFLEKKIKQDFLYKNLFNRKSSIDNILKWKIRDFHSNFFKRERKLQKIMENFNTLRNNISPSVSQNRFIEIYVYHYFKIQYICYQYLIRRAKFFTDWHFYFFNVFWW